MASCIVSGRITDVNGSPVSGAVVGFRLVSPGNEPVFDADGNALATWSKIVATDDNGNWSITLLQGQQFVIKIDAIRLHRQVTIPEEASATLEEVLNADV